MKTVDSQYCSRPFKQLEIDVDGKCYCCCRWWNKNYCLGSILEQNIDEIWNGEAAKKLRRTIIDGSYQYCNIKECLKEHSDEIEYKEESDYPIEISLCYDYSCTAKCVFCSDKIKKMSKEECQKWDSIIETRIIPLLCNAKYVRLSMVGELFVSEHSKKLVKYIADKYPNIKFEIVSNGIFANKENIQSLNIDGKISSVKFSVPSFNPKTYSKLVKNGNLTSVKNNMKYIASLKSANKINDFRLNFIITSLNYKELPEYAKYAEKLGAQIDCLILDRHDEATEFLKNYDKYNVVNPKHPDYNNFIDVINSKKLNQCKNVNINNNLKSLKKISFYEKIINIFPFGV